MKFMKNMMGNMMPVMFKGFVDHFYPAITEEERNAFIIHMTTNLMHSLPQSDKEKLLSELIQS
jgi:transposase-like protein